MLQFIQEYKKSVIAAAAVLASLLLTWAVEFFAPSWWEWFKVAVQDVASWLNEPVAISRLVAAIGLLALFAWPAFLTAKLLNRKRREKWRKYTNGTFDGIRWHWSYPYDNKIGDVIPRCEKDSTLLHRRKYFDDFFLKCDTCGEEHKLAGDYKAYERRLIRIIDRNLFTGQWKEEVKQCKPESHASHIPPSV